MQRVIALGRRAAASSIPVLIEGESGVGKELIARAIQGESERACKPFVTVNCGAIPENLVESILFGHERAPSPAPSTGASAIPGGPDGTLFPRRGRRTAARCAGQASAGSAGRRDRSRRRQAAGEGQLPPHLGDEPRHDPARQGRQVPRGSLLSAQRLPDPRSAVAQRLEDVPELSQYFVARFSAEEGKRVSGLTETALRLLQAYGWPGNVRQLENACSARSCSPTPRS